MLGMYVAMRYRSANINARRELGSQVIAFITGYRPYHSKGVAEAAERNDRASFLGVSSHPDNLERPSYMCANPPTTTGIYERIEAQVLT